MEKEVLEILVNQGLSTRGIAKTLKTSHTNIRYGLHRHNLTANFIPASSPRRCGHCGESNPSRFYGNKRTVCGACHSAYTTRQGQNKRLRAIEILGGKCKLCGFNLFSCSLDIHHTDPTVKAPNFRSLRGWSWNHILRELDKCVLLCKNCHAAIHAGLLQIEE